MTYDGGAHTATGTAKGVQGESLSGLDLSGTTHTNAGNTTAMPGPSRTHRQLQQRQRHGHDNIDKANATIMVTPTACHYDGAAHTATGTAKGVQGESLSGLDLSGTTHTNAGIYTE